MRVALATSHTAGSSVVQCSAVALHRLGKKALARMSLVNTPSQDCVPLKITPLCAVFKHVFRCSWQRVRKVWMPLRCWILLTDIPVVPTGRVSSFGSLSMQMPFSRIPACSLICSRRQSDGVPGLFRGLLPRVLKRSLQQALTWWADGTASAAAFYGTADISYICTNNALCLIL